MSYEDAMGGSGLGAPRITDAQIGRALPFAPGKALLRPALGGGRYDEPN